MKKALYILALAALFASCGGSKKTQGDTAKAMLPVEVTFSADSAYAFCEQQCAFGPRTMNSEAHELCGKWIAEKFRSYGLSVAEQQASLRGYDGTPLRSTNIIASYKPEAVPRLLVCAHWDSRPWADNDPDEANHHKPVMAANDGASGVAVMLEIARILSITHHPPPKLHHPPSASTSSASMPKTGAFRSGPMPKTLATRGHWAPSTGRRTRIATPTPFATAYCSTWWAASRPASIARATACNGPRRW